MDVNDDAGGNDDWLFQPSAASPPSMSLESLPKLRSVPRPIVASSKKSVESNGTNATTTSSQSSSVGSSTSSFMNNILSEPGGGRPSVFSHTPPTHLATSYETSHFGKRMRSGSISERLLVSSELESRGLIDREQKSVLKDRIIAGDHDLEEALDKYEEGDATVLESIILCGSLTKPDVDLMGRLDLEFLTVQDGPEPAFVGSGESLKPGTIYENEPMSKESVASDGIGDLDFDGVFETGPAFAQHSPMLSEADKLRLRSNSGFSTDSDFRSRSNSLFSPLIDAEACGGTSDYGRWTENQSLPTVSEAGIRIARPSRRASAPLLSNLSLSMSAHEFPVDGEDDEEATQEGSMNDDEMEGVTEQAEDNTDEKEVEIDRTKPSKQKKKKGRKLLTDKEKKLRKEKRDQRKAEEGRPAHISGSGWPRSLSDPNLRTSVDTDGLTEVERPEGWVGAYSPESRKIRIQRFTAKRSQRVWTKTVKYDVRKNFANSRLRVKGRFVKKEDELMMRELMGMT